MRAISGVGCLLLVSLSLSAQPDALTQGMQAFQEGRFVAARQHLAQALKEQPGNPHAQTFFALTQASTGHCAEAEPGLTNQSHDTAHTELRRLAGLALLQCRLAENRLPDALLILTQLQAAYPADPDVLYLAAKVHMRAWNDVTAQLFEKAPASYRVNQISAEVFETQNRYPEAIAEYRKAIAKSPRSLNLHYRLGRALLLQSHDAANLAQAQSEFVAELALNAEDAAAEFQLGQISLILNERPQAVEHFTRAAQLRPDFPEALTACAKLQMDDKQYTAAIPLLEQAIRLQPRNEAAHYSLMLAYRNAGQVEKAREQKQQLDRLQRPPEGEFTEFLKKIGEKQQPAQP